jgi:hypothetical protein
MVAREPSVLALIQGHKHAVTAAAEHQWNDQTIVEGKSQLGGAVLLKACAIDLFGQPLGLTGAQRGAGDGVLQRDALPEQPGGEVARARSLTELGGRRLLGQYTCPKVWPSTMIGTPRNELIGG